MRKKFYYLILCVLISVSVHARSIQNIFDSANTLYDKGDYVEALKQYQRVEKSLSHWKLFYNMGNCYFKLNRYVEAKINYLRARKFEPLHSSIEKNIQIVNKKFKNKIPEQKVDFISKILLKIESLISINLISWFLIIFILVLNISIFMVIKMGKKKVILYLLFFSLLLSVFASATHLYRNQKQSNHNLAVIIEPNSQLRSGPGDDNTVLFTVYPGLEVKIMEKSREWVQISAFSEIAGWIERDSLTVI